MSVAAILQTARRRPPRQILAYCLAVVLPLVSWVITTRVNALHGLPMSLHFLSMALVATLGGLGPALVAVFFSIAYRIYQVLPEPFTRSLVHSEILRSFILLSGALIISLMSRKRRISEERLELALSELQERTTALVESLNSSKCACWTFDLDSPRGIRWYSGSYPVFGRPFNEIEGLPAFTPVIHPDDQPRMPALFQHMKTSEEPIVFEFRAPWPDGQVHWLEMRGTRVPGRTCLWRGVTLDITERKLAEAALLRSEKLAAMGRLASTVAHEINNPLEAVTNLLFLARNDETLSQTTLSYLSMAERELARLGNITRLTLKFVRTAATASRIEMTDSIEDVLSILQHRLAARSIEVDRHYEPGVSISIAPHELRQIATNLIANAVEAVNGAEPKIAIRIAREQQKAVLLIADNGDGIPAANLQRIFEPFFSTREEIGTGIGLWVTREIVEKYGGRISVESGELDSGFRTCFRIEFPLVESLPRAELTESAKAFPA